MGKTMLENHTLEIGSVHCSKRYTDFHFERDIEECESNKPHITYAKSNGKKVVYLSKRTENKKKLGIVEFGEGFEYVAPTAFKDDFGIQGVKFNDDFTGGIGGSAFCGCINLESAVLSKQIKFIDADAFKDCFSLASIYLPSSLEYLSPKAFAGSGLRVIVCDENMEEKVENLQQIGMLSKIYVIDKDGLCVDRKSFKAFRNCVDDTIALKAEMKAIENMILANPENVEVLRPVIDRIPVTKLSAFLIQYRTVKPIRPNKKAEEASI